jgi:hypothetical protein
VGLVISAVVLVGAWYGYAYSVSPHSIRQTSSTHKHLRLQIINGGTPVNFAEGKFQTPENKDLCTAALTKDPVHFHDGLDQFVHLHWTGVTGGILLKDYGWNFLGGTDRTLGYQFKGFKLVRVPIHGQALPRPPASAKYYVYTGDADSYKERNWDEFLGTDLVKFLGMSDMGSGNWFIPAAYAHGDGGTLQDLIGNVVIFVQKDKPTDSQIKDRFQKLLPEPESSCNG